MLGILFPLVWFSSHATLQSWSGAGSPNITWTNIHNWASNVAPVPGDDLQFTDGAMHPASSNNFPAGVTFNSIAFVHGGSGSTGQRYDLRGSSIALNAGISVVNNSGAGLWDNSLNNGITLNSNQTFSTGSFASLSLSGAINLNGKILTFDNPLGWPIDAHGAISGQGGLIKNNSGTLTLYSNSTYTGSTIISNGTLALNGSIGIPNSTNIVLAGASAIWTAGNGSSLLWSGQTLSGIGSVSTALTAFSGAAISPGNNGIGILTLNNGLTLDTGATLLVSLSGTNAGTSYNQLNVQGAVAILNATLAMTLGYTPVLGDSFIIIHNAGGSAVSGTFNGLAEGSFFTNSGISFRITYAGGDGNDVVITRANVPVTRIVTTTADSGAGSLRAALAGGTNGDTIMFAPNVTGAITLTTGELLVNHNVSILGPGPAVLAVDGNAASRVFHIINTATVAISGLTLRHGSAAGSSPVNLGGGIFNDHSILTVSNCTLSGNSATVQGGGIYNNGINGSATLIMIASTCSSNSVGGGSGGAIYNDHATLTVSNCTLSGNSGFTGAAFYNDGESGGSATLTVSASTFSGNSAASYGGAIDNDGFSGNAGLTITACTLNGNSGGTAGGIFSDARSGGTATVAMADTILKAGSSGSNIATLFGTVTSLGYNLSSDSGSGFLTNTTDVINTDPLLGPLQDNGGPTLTCALLWGSPAIDKGKAFGLSTDQRGQPRPFDFASMTNATGGDGSDIGAFELNPQARFVSIAALTNRSILLQGLGISNFTYTIQAATNLIPLIHWTNISASTASPTGSFSVTDTNAPLFPARFYRAVWP